jgi:hypothetical protein
LVCLFGFFFFFFFFYGIGSRFVYFQITHSHSRREASLARGGDGVRRTDSALRFDDSECGPSKAEDVCNSARCWWIDSQC